MKSSALLVGVFAIAMGCGSGQESPLDVKQVRRVPTEVQCNQATDPGCCGQLSSTGQVLCHCPARANDSCAQQSGIGNTWDCGNSGDETLATVCPRLKAGDPWENCRQPECAGNKVFCIWAYPNNAAAVLNNGAGQTRCDLDPSKQMVHEGPSTDFGICSGVPGGQGDWTCIPCPAGMKRRIGDPLDAACACTMNNNACTGHAGQAMFADDGCGNATLDCRNVPCNATTCPSGCCSGAVCQAGTADGACGTGGATCSNCTALGDTCNTSKACVAPAPPPPTCGPGNCTGCCANQGNTCVGGGTNSACGQGGIACETCDGFDTICKTGGTHHVRACRPR